MFRRLIALAVLTILVGVPRAGLAQLFVGQVAYDEPGASQDGTEGLLRFRLKNVAWNGTQLNGGIDLLFGFATVLDGGFRADLVVFPEGAGSGAPIGPLPQGAGLTRIGTSSTDGAAALLETWSTGQRALAGWIVANSEELVNASIAAGQVQPEVVSRWAEVAALFEDFLRDSIPSLDAQTALIDRVNLRNEEMMRAMLGSDVQPGLEKLGFYNGGVDGIWGPGSESGVRAFQTSLGTLPSGRLTPLELAVLRAVNITGLGEAALSLYPVGQTVVAQVQAAPGSVPESVPGSMPEPTPEPADQAAPTGPSQAEMDQLQAQLDQLRTDAEAALRSADAEIASLNQRLVTAESTRAEAEQTVAQLRADLSRMGEAATAQTTTDQTPDESTDTPAQDPSNAEMAALTAQVATLTEAVAQRETQLSQQSAEVVDLRTRLNALQDERDQVAATLQAEQAERARLSAALSTANQSLQRLRETAQSAPQDSDMPQNSQSLSSNTSLSALGEVQTVPMSRFMTVRQTLTRQVSALNSALVQTRDSAAGFQTRLSQTQADFDAFRETCAKTPDCARAMGL